MRASVLIREWNLCRPLHLRKKLAFSLTGATALLAVSITLCPASSYASKHGFAFSFALIPRRMFTALAGFPLSPAPFKAMATGIAVALWSKACRWEVNLS